MSVSGPFRGVHLPHGGGLRAIDRTALTQFAPGAVVALLKDVVQYSTLLSWLVSNQNSVEIFLRYFPCPVVPQNTPGFQNYTNLSSSAAYMTASAAASDIVSQVNTLRNAGLTNFRVIVGNEPDIEWDTSAKAQWNTPFWSDVTNLERCDELFQSDLRRGGWLGANAGAISPGIPARSVRLSEQLDAGWIDTSRVGDAKWSTGPFHRCGHGVRRVLRDRTSRSLQQRRYCRTDDPPQLFLSRISSFTGHRQVSAGFHSDAHPTGDAVTGNGVRMVAVCPQ